MGRKSRARMKLRSGSSVNMSFPSSLGSGMIGGGSGVNTGSIKTRRRSGLTTPSPEHQMLSSKRERIEWTPNKGTRVLRLPATLQPYTESELHECELCGRRFLNVELHKHYSHPNRPLPKPLCACPNCDKRFTSDTTLQQHLESVHKAGTKAGKKKSKLFGHT